MTWLVILGACLAAFGHGVALRKGREIRRPGFLGAFGIFDPDAENLLRAVRQDAERDVDGLVPDKPLVPDLDPDGVRRPGDKRRRAVCSAIRSLPPAPRR